MKRPHETPEERENAKIARFSQYVLSQEAWFRIADELEPAMKLLEPQIERFWAALTVPQARRSTEAVSVIETH